MAKAGRFDWAGLFEWLGVFIVAGGIYTGEKAVIFVGGFLVYMTVFHPLVVRLVTTTKGE